jgi:NitT/TauT family transport system substrate-binding protein
MSVRRTTTTLTAVLIGAAIALTGCAAQTETTDPEASPAAADDPAEQEEGEVTEERERVELNIGYIDTSINGVGIIEAANQLDLWEDAGIDANLTPFTNGPTQIQAMAAGSLDIGYIGGGATWMPASGQAVIIAPSEVTYGDYLLAHPNSGATELTDLAGLRVGVPDGGSGEMILNLALKEAGLTVDDIERVPLDPPSVVSAFVSGQIDVAAIFSPLSDQILESVPDTVVLANNRDFPDTAFVGAWVASNQAIQDNPEGVARFLEVYYQANDYRVENTEEVVAWAAAASGAPQEQLQGQADNLEWFPSSELLEQNESGLTAERFEALQELFVELGRMEAPNPVEQWVNTDLLAQAAQNVA